MRTTTKRMKDINDILGSYFLGEATQEEELKVKEWAKENPEEFKVLESVLKEDVIEVEAFDADNAWAKFEQKIEIEEKPVKVIPIRRWFSIAASLTLLVGATLYYTMFSPSLITITAQKNMEHKMPDGSIVSLQKGSVLEFSESFNEDRQLSLSGEGYFEVQHQDGNPFIVHTSQGDVRVLGTKFNVEVGENSVQVNVTEGKVRLSRDDQSIDLTKGMQASASNSGVLEDQDFDVNYMAWKTGYFHFDNNSLEDVVESLSEKYGDIFELNTHANCHITADLTNQTAEEIVRILEVTCDLNIAEKDGVYVIN